jgi:AraC-like DNA-binding protein
MQYQFIERKTRYPMHKKILGNDENRASRGFDERGLLAIPGRGSPGKGKRRSVRSRLAEPPAITSAARASSTVSFSTDDLPEQDRVAMWREHFGRTALRVEIEPAEEGPFEASVTSRSFTGLHLLQSGLSAARLTRTRELIADGNDDLILVINRTGSIEVSARGREVSIREGEALLRSSDEVTVFERAFHGDSLTLRIPRAILSSLVADVDGATMRAIPRQSGALKLLTSYVKALIDEEAPATAQLQHLIVSHVSDLAALTLGATRDAECMARVRGIPAARLRAAKTYVLENCARRDLSIGMVAAHLGVTPRYLQRLFEIDGKTFSTWLLNQRLTRAHRLLCKSKFAEQAVSAIAYDVGFGDLSYFNRCFRKLYGVTPRDVREAAAR